MEKRNFGNEDNSGVEKAFKNGFSLIHQVNQYNASADSINFQIIPGLKSESEKIVGFDDPMIRDEYKMNAEHIKSLEYKQNFKKAGEGIINSFEELKDIGLTNYFFKKKDLHVDSIGMRVGDVDKFSKFLEIAGNRKLNDEEKIFVYRNVQMISEWILQSFSDKYDILNSEKSEDALDFLTKLPSMIGKVKSLENKIDFTNSSVSKGDFSSAVYLLSKIIDFYSQNSLDAFSDIFNEKQMELYEIRDFYQDKDFFIRHILNHIKKERLLQEFLETKYQDLKSVYEKLNDFKYKPVFEYLYKYEKDLAESGDMKYTFLLPREHVLIDNFKKKIEILKNKADEMKY